ncbi:tyrosine-type recombinase/integrase [Bradyrhizobium sp. CCBAU 11361]|uniref:tyrosine-type recombinase/integrase n=1 Tax=Bradyrhizobium sp. CCBAU 11361 TaxID=1630812 RepID=UPI0023057001|nr:site-specific integrase [Bradyrhizobium sp. CCBAU 11361]MDA9492404.1 integrase [Bradyrhizobium sp. CCBAU 11361]
MVKIFCPDKTEIEKLGFASVAHVPVIFDSNEVYCREYNRYLRERAELDWHPSATFYDRPSPRTLSAIAEKLANWISWCETRKITWQTVTYDDVLRYQDEQDTGAWSKSGKPLERSTANGRADAVTHFLIWASHRGLRSEFKVTFILDRKQIAGRVRTLTVRHGRLKEPYGQSRIDAFKLPHPHGVREWLEAVKTQRGYAKYLACRFILETGARLREVELFPLAGWPTIEKIDEAAYRGDVFVEVKLTRGTKGGRPRTIRVPIDLARTIRLWSDGPRNKYVFGLYKRTNRRTDHLFVSDAAAHIGTPILRHTISKCFAEVTPRPKVWSPHKGRHAFACFFVLYALETEARAHKSTAAAMGVNWVHSRGAEWLKMLQRQFGHVDEDTTQIYLHWLSTALNLTKMANGWHRFLAGDEDI